MSILCFEPQLAPKSLACFRLKKYIWDTNTGDTCSNWQREAAILSRSK